MISGRVSYSANATKRLDNFMANVKGPGAMRFGQAVAKDVDVGNRDDRLRNVDRHGKTLPPRKHPREDGANGPVLAPHGDASRSITTFRARVVRTAAGWVLSAGFGFIPLAYHAKGMVKGAPVRDLMGISPKTWAKINKRKREWIAGLFRKSGYRG